VRVLSGQGNRMIDRIQAEATSMLASPKKVHYRFAIGGMLFFTDHALCQLLIKQGSARPSKPPRSGWPTSTPTSPSNRRSWSWPLRWLPGAATPTAKANDRTRKLFNTAVFERLDVKGGRLCHERYRPPFDAVFNASRFE
jgi:hypothetical protein